MTTQQYFDIPARVYFEDTDAGGIMFYARYLAFIERGRTEVLREIIFDQMRLKFEDHTIFVVRRVEADYLSPAYFDDYVTIRTYIDALGGASITMRQEVRRGDDLLFSAKVALVAAHDTEKRAVRIPADMREKLSPYLPSPHREG